PLSAVGDLRATSNAGSVTISWSAPFSLDVTGVDPDIWYSVLIYNVTDENNPTAILCTDCINITETHYTFTPDYLSPCHVYNFSVIPLNGAGQGESSPFISGYVLKCGFVKEPCIEAVSRSVSRVTFQILGCICSYRMTPKQGDGCIIAVSRSLEELTFDLCSDGEYSFEVSTSPIPITTHDVQSATVTSVRDDGEIIVTAEFLKNTTARGCFVVLQSGNESTADVFRALLRPGPNTTLLTSTISDTPSSTYRALFYDLEEDGLPNRSPAYEPNNVITVNRNDADPNVASKVLNNVSLVVKDSVVQIRCEFKEGIEGASCVLVYREYGNKTLVVEEYPQNTVFPVTLTVDGDQYTFAVFGKSSFDLDERPILARNVHVTRTTTTPQTEVATSDEERIMDTQVVAISIGTALAGVMICVTAVLVLLVVVRQCHTHRKKRSAVPVAVYDEVVLPLTTTSSIPTEPSHTTTIPTTGNVAYETTTPINTAHNVAYETHKIQSN
ncbi:hypothetical protein GBAR_LOCUS18816, partial [Geodia barretti]